MTAEYGKIFMFMDQQNKYCENNYSTESNLQIQCNPIKFPMSFFTETNKKNPKIHRDHKRPQKTKVILSKTSNTENITIGDVK
jgi:hypothetical protein